MLLKGFGNNKHNITFSNKIKAYAYTDHVLSEGELDSAYKGLTYKIHLCVPVWLSGRALHLQRNIMMGSIPREHTY